MQLLLAILLLLVNACKGGYWMKANSTCSGMVSYYSKQYYPNFTAVGLRQLAYDCTVEACKSTIRCQNSYASACHNCYILQTEKMTRDNHSTLCASHGYRARLAWLHNIHILKAIAIAYAPPRPDSFQRDLTKYTHFFTGLEIDPAANEWTWQYERDRSGRAFKYFPNKGKHNYELDEIGTDKNMLIRLSDKAKEYLDDVTSFIDGTKPQDTKKNQITFNMDDPDHPKLEIVRQDEKLSALCELPIPRCIEIDRYKKFTCPVFTSSLPPSTGRATDDQPTTTEPAKAEENTVPDQPADSNELIPIIVGGIAGVLLICALFIIVGLAWKMDKVRREIKNNSNDDSSVPATDQGSVSPAGSKQKTPTVK